MKISKQKHQGMKGNPRPGVVLIFALVSIVVALIGGASVLFTASAQHSGTVLVRKHALARLATESALTAAIAHIEHDPDWINQASLGVWHQEIDIDGVPVDIEVTMPGLAGPPVSIQDPSFETQIATLPTPLFSPPMSGVIGGWRVSRTALVQTGLTVPNIGTRLSVNATDGTAHAFISFGASVSGSGKFTQTIDDALIPNAIYQLSADILPNGLPPIDSSFGMRLYADNVLVASTQEALVLVDGLGGLLQDLLGDAQALLDQALLPATLLRTLLSGSTSRYTLTFETPDVVPPGEVRLELFAESVGLLTSVAFDNIHLEVLSNEPMTISAIGSVDGAGHRVDVRAIRDMTGRCMIVRWDEP